MTDNTSARDAAHSALADSGTSPAAEAPQAGSTAPNRWRSDVAIGTLTALGIFVVLLIRYRWLFDGPVHFGGDEGNQFGIARDAVILRELRGGGSRTGFHHPGPAYSWIWGSADVLRSWLHLPIGRHNMQMLGADVAVAVQLSAAAMLVPAHLGSLVRGVVVLVALVALALDPGLVGGPWLPHMYYVTFVLFVLAGVSLAAGRLASLPIFVVTAAMLVHGHIAYTSFTGAATLVLLIVLWRRDQLRELWSERRSLLWWCVGILAVFAAPIVANTLLNWPGEFGLYLEYLRDPESGSNSLVDSMRYVLQFWPGTSSVTRAAVAVASLAALGAISWWRRSQFGAALIVGVVLMELCLLQYAMGGVDDLTYRYAAIWAYALPGLVLGVAVAMVLPDMWCPPTTWPQWLAVAALGVIGWTVVTRSTAMTYLPVDFDTTPAVVDQMERATDGRTLVINAGLDDVGAYLLTSAVLSEAEDRGLDVCFVDENWSTKFGEWRVCDGDERADGQWFTIVGGQNGEPKPIDGKRWTLYQSAFVIEGRRGR